MVRTSIAAIIVAVSYVVGWFAVQPLTGVFDRFEPIWGPVVLGTALAYVVVRFLDRTSHESTEESAGEPTDESSAV